MSEQLAESPCQSQIERRTSERFPIDEENSYLLAAAVGDDARPAQVRDISTKDRFEAGKELSSWAHGVFAGNKSGLTWPILVIATAFARRMSGSGARPA